MFYRLRTQIEKRIFNQRCREILASPPVGLETSGPIILTQLINIDLLMYLVAIKSLYHRMGMGRIVVLLDKHWSRDDLDLLQRHIRPWKTLFVKDRTSKNCPKGGTWERLLTIADLVEEHYVVQLDADTVSLGPMPEVQECIASETSFMIGTWKGQRIEPASVSAQRASKSESQHVQIVSEQGLSKLNGSENLRYARGQSSFAGFAKGSLSVERLEAFSQSMSGLLGEEKWSQWGSESFASNFCVANAQNSIVLPWPKYGSYNPKRDVDFDSSVFLHFEGTNRFKNGAYVKAARQIIGHILGRQD